VNEAHRACLYSGNDLEFCLLGGKAEYQLRHHISLLSFLIDFSISSGKRQCYQSFQVLLVHVAVNDLLCHNYTGYCPLFEVRGSYTESHEQQTKYTTSIYRPFSIFPLLCKHFYQYSGSLKIPSLQNSVPAIQRH
jgi:hypothetical protein